MTAPINNPQVWLPELREIATVAGNKICEIYKKEFEVKYKSDQSPVTAADLLSHEYITERLEKLTPDLPILSEESGEITFLERQSWESYWLIDPLDGTREFINKRDDFTINIALIHQHRPILGVVHIPVINECYTASVGNGAYKYLANGSKKKLQVRERLTNEVVAAVSFSHAGGKTQNFLDEIGKHQLLRRGSMVKCCLIAEGKADIYPRLGSTCEWDTAAGQCILEESGGRLTDWQGEPLRYNTKDSIINPHFVAYAPSVEHLIKNI